MTKQKEFSWKQRTDKPRPRRGEASDERGIASWSWTTYLVGRAIDRSVRSVWRDNGVNCDDDDDAAEINLVIDHSANPNTRRLWTCIIFIQFGCTFCGVDCVCVAPVQLGWVYQLRRLCRSVALMCVGVGGAVCERVERGELAIEAVTHGQRLRGQRHVRSDPAAKQDWTERNGRGSSDLSVLCFDDAAYDYMFLGVCVCVRFVCEWDCVSFHVYVCVFTDLIASRKSFSAHSLMRVWNVTGLWNILIEWLYDFKTELPN